MVAVFFGVVALGVESGVWPIACAVIGALLGFLLFNVHPASVFMGDTGSLALGGFVASIAYMLQMPIFILIVGLIYWIEIFSVIIQVGYFKISHGKRIFRMAPIHHHFELGGWSETKVVAVFTIVTAMLCLIGLMAL
jgi:phospho-N-acetylmuramoyl-pentapeptide-transferase